MELKEILAVSGQPGLFKFVAQAKNGIIVESLLTGARTSVSSSSKVSALAEIAIYTDGDEVALADIFTKIYEANGGKETVSPKSSPEELKKVFAGVLPDYDRDRVHVSDIKKVIAWYNALVGAGMTEFKSAEQEEEAAEEKAAEKPAAAKPAAVKKPAAAKPAAAKSAAAKPASAKKAASQKSMSSKRGA